MREIELRIDELVIDGVSQTDGIRTGDAFSRELMRLIELSPSTLFAHEQDVDRLDAGTFATPRPAQPSAIGVAAAQAIHRRFGP
jgi:hypothetical protein